MESLGAENGGRIATLLRLAGLATAPWLVLLGSQLPETVRVSGWATAWLGLDALEGAALFGTGVLLARRDARARVAAAAGATLLVVDAWFDLTTSAWGRPLLVAALEAACVELPLAAVCAAVALRRGRKARS